MVILRGDIKMSSGNVKLFSLSPGLTNGSKKHRDESPDSESGTHSYETHR